MRTLVDSNVILDLLSEPSQWRAWSLEAVRGAANIARLVINPVIFAEISVGYSSIEDVDIALGDLFEREAIPFEAAFLAGKAFTTYRRRSGDKRSPLPDLFIGAHAAVLGYDVLTRDAKRYRSYFPNVPLITPI